MERSRVGLQQSREIGCLTEVVAEISGNHGGSLKNALELVRQAKWAGADAVKFQCFNPERLAEKRSKNPEVLALAGGVPLIDLYSKTHTPRDWFPALIEEARSQDIAWFSSVFDPLDVDFLEHFDCPRYKISAFEMLDWELIKAVKETGKPIVMSVRSTKNVQILLANNYDGSDAGHGYSDHSGCIIPRDAPMIEWHLKLTGVVTPDSEFSITADEMRQNIECMKQVRSAA